jgi:nitroreductase
MKTKMMILVFMLSVFSFMGSFPACAADQSAIQLPKPQMDGGKPLMQALKDRMTSRAFAADKIPVQTLSNLLWAAFGINRPDGRRTAPSAKNWQEIDIYVATPDGAYLYDAKGNELKPVSPKDLRALTGTQAYAGEAAIDLVYVADFSKVEGGGMDQNTLAGADTGFIAQNVYLYCASEGLADVVRASIDRDALGKELNLKKDQKIILGHSIGYPKK